MNFSGPAWSASVFNSFEPAYWGLPEGDFVALADWGRKFPDTLWNTLFSDISRAGVAGVDLGVEPFDWRSAVRWAGSASEFGKRLQDGGLALSSSYQSGHALTELVDDADALASFKQDFAEHADFVVQAGAETLVLGAPLASPQFSPGKRLELFKIVDSLGAIAKNRGVKLAIHTEAYADWTSEAAIDELMANTKLDTVFLCPDTGHIALHGGDPVAVITKHWDRIIAFHFKDTRSSRPETRLVSPEEAEARMMEEFCIAGEGIVDWEAIAAIVVSKGFAGWCVAEVDCAAEPAAATAAIVTAIRKAGVNF